MELTRLFTIILFLLIGNGVLAQDIEWDKRMRIHAQIDSLVYLYASNFGLTELSSGQIDEEMVREFTSLFSPNATIGDDMNPLMIGDSLIIPLVFERKSVGEVVADFKLRYPRGLKEATVSFALPQYSMVGKGLVPVTLIKYARGVVNTDFGGNTLGISDTVKLYLDIDTSTVNVKIAYSEIVGARVVCENCDSDKDKVYDQFDKCPNEPGSVRNNGCPYNSVLLFNAAVSAGYNNLDAADIDLNYFNGLPESSRTILSDLGESKSLTYGLGAGLKYLPLLGGKLGFGLGFEYDYISGTFVMDTFNVTEEISDEAYGNFWQSYGGSDVEEKLSTSRFALPLKLLLRLPVGSGLFIEPYGGVKYSVELSSSTSSNLFMTSEISAYFDSETSKFRTDTINNYRSSASATTEILEKLKGSSIGAFENVLKAPLTTETELTYDPTLILIAGVNVSARLSERMYVDVGLGADIGKFESGELVWSVAEESGEYESALKGSESLSFVAYRISIGLSLSLY